MELLLPDMNSMTLGRRLRAGTMGSVLERPSDEEPLASTAPVAFDILFGGDFFHDFNIDFRTLPSSGPPEEGGDMDANDEVETCD